MRLPIRIRGGLSGILGFSDVEQPPDTLGLWLEQEHIGFGWVESALAALRSGLKATGQ